MFVPFALAGAGVQALVFRLTGLSRFVESAVRVCRGLSREPAAA